MSEPNLSPEDVALVRLTGGLLIASGLLIAALCGGCTLNVLRSAGSDFAASLALIIGGAPAAGGLFLVSIGFKQLSRARLVSTAPRAKVGPPVALGWALAGLGVLIALGATYQIILDGWVLLNAAQHRLNSVGGASIAFSAALEHALLFIPAAAAVEIGRRIMHGGRS